MLRVQFLPESQEDVRHPGGDRRQTIRTCVTRGAKSDHEVRIRDTGSVLNDNPVPAAANPAGMPIPLQYSLCVPSEALRGMPAPVVVGKAHAGLLDPTGKKRGRSRVTRVSSQAQVYFLGTIVTVC